MSASRGGDSTGEDWMTGGGYLLDNRAVQAGQRFGALAALFNPVTFRHMEALGVGEGWRCWEVGAGGPSVPRWLAERVGPSGHVLATDLDVSWIGDGPGAGVEVRRHDVVEDDPPAGGFDLVHARLVLVHVPARDEALRRMVSSLRPGGWLLIEDFDMELQPLASIEAYRPEQHLANKLRVGFRALLRERGADPTFGRKLPRVLGEQGLVGVSADGYLPVDLPAMGVLDAANITQVREGLVAGGHVTDEEIERHLAACDGGLGLASPILISAWGRRSP